MQNDIHDDEEIIEFYEETSEKYQLATQKIFEYKNKLKEAAVLDTIPPEQKRSLMKNIDLEVKKWEEGQRKLLEALEFIKKDLPDVEMKLKDKKEFENKKESFTKEPQEFKKPDGFWGGIFNKFTKTINFFGKSAPQSAEDLKNKMKEELVRFEARSTKDGVNFSRCNMSNIVKAYSEGRLVEFECTSVVIGKVIHEAFPNARTVVINDKDEGVQAKAEQLVEKLEEKGNIKRVGESIYFVNPESENPDYKELVLRLPDGAWSGEALNAATYLKAENLEIVHLMILPDYLKDRQDKVWEILRILGIKPTNYHDIFFNEKTPPEKTAEVIKQEIERNK